MFEHYAFQGFKKSLSRFGVLGFFIGRIFSGDGGVMVGSAACLDVIGWLAPLINDGVVCPYNGNHMYEHIIYLYLKPSQ